nr:MAG TPA: Flagellar and Swarming motility protein [Caudoviricetes sp.]
MLILNAKFEDNVTVILNPRHIVMIKDYGDGAVISTTLNSRTGILHVKESKEEVLRMIQEETFYDYEF